MALFTNGSALIQAGIMQTELALSEVALYKELAAPLSPSTVLADITEADFDGYARQTITAFLAPYLDPDGGASINGGMQQFQFVAGAPPVTTNVVVGWYLLNAAGDLIAAGDFDNPVGMTSDGQAIPVVVVLNFGKS